MPATDCAIIILAAGSSSRLGSPKQLLMFEGKSLLQRAIDEAIASGIGDAVVITGANHDRIVSSLSGSKADFIYNKRWQQGMASSMQTGLSALLAKYPDLDTVIVILCDQPYVSSMLLRELLAKRKTTDKGIIACEYKDTLGVPVLFSRAYFDALLSLKGTEGAKKIIAANVEDTDSIHFAQGAVDIDTKDDYENLIK